MSRRKRYKFDPETLTYEIHKIPFSRKFFKTSLFFLLSVGMFFVYLYLYTSVLGLETPKTSMIKKSVTEWHSKLDLINQRFDKANSILTELQMRDNVVYRPVFGMEEISADVRDAGFGGVDRYDYLQHLDYSGLLTSTAKKLDILYKKAYVQSRSLDDVSVLAKRAGEMALCVPTISPVTTDSRIYQSSFFGVRLDPITRRPTMHNGVDLVGPSGEPIYATGDGVVVSVTSNFFGYGNYVIIDHGFGYKTRYAHLRAALVSEGQRVTRGEQIGEMGNTGKSMGTHLHYEVIFKNQPVNPLNYFNSNISPQDYALIVKPKHGKAQI